MKILFLFPYPLHESPSQRFRFEQYFTKLASLGIIFWTSSFWGEAGWRILYSRGKYFLKAYYFSLGVFRRILILFKAPLADFVFIHRECLPIGPPIIEWIIAKIFRKKIIYDFDDAIWLPNTSAENKLAAFVKWHSKVAAICKWSYKISCGNSYLSAYAKRFNVRVIINPTTIDTDMLHNPALHSTIKLKDAVTIGWTGTHSTLKYLEIIIPIIRRLELKFANFRFLVIANKRPLFTLKSMIYIPWSKGQEIEDLLKIDIGIMPLSDDIWSQSKCGFKALQYMALNIPVIASPVGVNNTIIDHGLNGFLCNTEDEWIDCLEKLIQQADRRFKIGEAGRKKVVDCYSVSSNSSTFLSLFE